MSYYLSLEEQETVIGRTRTEDSWSVWTSDRTMMTVFDRLARDPDSAWTLTAEEYTADGSLVSKKYKCPKECISTRKKPMTRTLTDEQRQAAAERLSKARKKLKEGVTDE